MARDDFFVRRLDVFVDIFVVNIESIASTSSKVFMFCLNCNHVILPKKLIQKPVFVLHFVVN